MQTSIGSSQIIPFLLAQNSLNWHFLAWHEPSLSQCSTAQARNLEGISQVVNQGWLLLVWRQLSGWLHKCSLHLIAFLLVPCTLFYAVVQTFLATKSFTAGSSMDPCHLACVLKSVPRDVISLIGCSTQLPISAVGVTCVSQGWLLNIPFLRSSWSSGFLRRFAHDNASEQSLLAETLEGTLCWTPQVTQ